METEAKKKAAREAAEEADKEAAKKAAKEAAEQALLPRIRIYTGKIREWTRDRNGKEKREEKRQTLCGRRLLAYGLADIGREDIWKQKKAAEDVVSYLERRIEKGAYGKPYFKEYKDLYFNISHSGEYACCAVSSVPCGLDIQEVRPLKSKRLTERTMSLQQQKEIWSAEMPEREFCKYWSMKESFLKLTGEGIIKDMRDIPFPDWYQLFWIQEQTAGCISAEEPCIVEYREADPNLFFRKLCKDVTLAP